MPEGSHGEVTCEERRVSVRAPAAALDAALFQTSESGVTSSEHQRVTSRVQTRERIHRTQERSPENETDPTGARRSPDDQRSASRVSCPKALSLGELINREAHTRHTVRTYS